MSLVILPQPQRDGTINLRVSEGPDGPIVDRRVLVPGSFAETGWVDTDLSDETPAIRALARELWTPDLVAGWQAAHPWVAPPPLLPYQLFRSTFVERMEPDEAALLEIALAAAEPKLRLMYGSVDYFVSDDPLFAVLHWTVALALGSEDEPDFARADELLAPM